MKYSYHKSTKNVCQNLLDVSLISSNKIGIVMRQDLQINLKLHPNKTRLTKSLIQAYSYRVNSPNSGYRPLYTMMSHFAAFGRITN